MKRVRIQQMSILSVLLVLGSVLWLLPAMVATTDNLLVSVILAATTSGILFLFSYWVARLIQLFWPSGFSRSISPIGALVVVISTLCVLAVWFGARMVTQGDFVQESRISMLPAVLFLTLFLSAWIRRRRPGCKRDCDRPDTSPD